MILKLMENEIVGIYIDDCFWGILAHVDALHVIDPRLVETLKAGEEVVFELVTEGDQNETD